ncbi:MAG: hypothetical protein HY760_04220 [Nitrospirae bacterium]|nr:hypothetical protein [Nitrospirota bacterium]
MTKTGWTWHKIGYKIFIVLEVLFISWILYEFVVLYVSPGKMDWWKEGSRIIKTTE